MGFAWALCQPGLAGQPLVGDGLVILAMIIWGLLTGAFITPTHTLSA